MSFPAPFEPPYSFQSELGTAFGTHLDASFDDVAEVLNSVLANLELIQRDDGAIRNQTVHSNTFTSDALALMAGSSVSSDLDWLPRGFWVTATLYRVGNIVETGSPAVAYVCAVQHTSGVFATDYAAGKWVVLSSPRTLVSADVTGALGYTPVNIAGDTMTGALVLTTGSKIGGASGMTFTDTLLAQDLITIDKGLYSAYESDATDIIYGFAANVLRSSGNYRTVGAQCSAIVNSGVNEIAFGSNFNAIGLNGHLSALVGQEIDVGSFTPNNSSNKYGLNIILFTRAGDANPAGYYNYTFPFGTYSSVGGGLGSNYYNRNAKAIVIESQERSSTSEYSGWPRGIVFGEYALGPENDPAYAPFPAYAIGVDFSELHYYGGTDPVTAYGVEAVIAMRDFQPIWWNRDPSTAATATNKVKTYFNPATSRWVIDNGGIERFGLDVSTGALYLNGSAFSTISLAGNNTWTGTNTFNNTVTVASTLAMGGLARRITGDFSNTTVSNRVLVQTTTVNQSTEFGLIPNGGGGESAFYALSDADTVDCQVLRMAVSTTQAQITSGVTGAGFYVPMVFGAAGAERMRIDETQGQVIIGATSVTIANALLRVAGIIQIDNPVAFSVHRNGTNFVLANSTPTVIDFTNEDFDTNGNYDLGANTFTPPEGMYALYGAILNAAGTGVDQGAIVVSIYKNGAVYKSGVVNTMSGAGTTGSMVYCIAQANGSDYFQLVATQVTGGPLTCTGVATDTWFQGNRVG